MKYEGYIGGIIGALATYLLMRGKEISEKILARYNKHRTALVKLEQIYCENLDIIQRNIDNAEKLIKTIEDSVKINAVPLFFGKFHLIPYDKTVLIELTTIDFMNDVLSLNIDYARTNSDMDTIVNIYEKLTPFLIQQENAEPFLNDLKKLKKFVESIDVTTEEMLAKVQTLLKFKSPILIRFIGLFMQRKGYNKKFNKMYPEVLERVKKGRAEVARESKERLEKIYQSQKSSNDSA